MAGIHNLQLKVPIASTLLRSVFTRACFTISCHVVRSVNTVHLREEAVSLPDTMQLTFIMAQF